MLKQPNLPLFHPESYIESYECQQYTFNADLFLFILVIQRKESWCWLFLGGGTPFTLWWIKNIEAMLPSFYDPNLCPMSLWTFYGCYEIVFLESKYSVSKIYPSLFSDDSGCCLLCAPIQMYYVFMSISFTCHKAPSLCCRLSFLS